MKGFGFVQANTYFLMDMGVERVLPWSEAVGLPRGYGAGLLARNDVNAVERAQALGRVERVQQALADVKRRQGALVRAGEGQVPAFEPALAKSKALAASAVRLFGAEAPNVGSAGFFDAGTGVIQAIETYADALNARLHAALQERLDSLTRKLALAGRRRCGRRSPARLLLPDFLPVVRGCLEAVDPGHELHGPKAI